MKIRVKCNYENGVFKPIKALPGHFDLNNIIIILDEFQEDEKIGTRFCGVWRDDRTAEEICQDIKEHRSGYGQRRVNW